MLKTFHQPKFILFVKLVENDMKFLRRIIKLDLSFNSKGKVGLYLIVVWDALLEKHKYVEINRCKRWVMNMKNEAQTSKQS